MSDFSDKLKNPIVALGIALCTMGWQAVDELRGGRTAPETREALEAIRSQVGLLQQSHEFHVSQLGHPHGVETRAAKARAEIERRVSLAEHSLTGLDKTIERLAGSVDRLASKVGDVERALIRGKAPRRKRQ